jgi:ribosomal protein S12 methylthiotransferase accessory factor YcaO
VRAWWRCRHGEWPGVPVRCDSAWVSSRLDALQSLAPALEAQRAQQILALEANGPAPRAHAVAPRPQCPACGAPTLMAERQRRPIVPAPGPLSASEAGGRSMSPQFTVERLRAHVSPLCGVVSHLDRLAPQDEDGLAVHRSGFFKTARAGDAALAETFTQTCLGKGPSTAQSQASALCEAVERYAAFYQGDEAFTSGAALSLEAPCILPHELAPMDRREGRGAAGACRPETPMRWAPAWSLTRHARCHLPLGFCYAHAPEEDARHIGWTSNGCAAGNTLEEAIVQGFLELVERDAVAIWWYNQIERPAADPADLPAHQRQRVAHALGAPWDHWVLDITHDIGIPVAAAIARHRGTKNWAVGFGCGLGLAQACQRALTELVQLVAVDKHVPVPQALAPFDAPGFLLPSSSATPPQPWRARARSNIAETINDCVQAAAALGLETIVLDYSRPDIALHTVKVVVPGLCHIWPELTTARLFQVPVTLGWRQRPLTRPELNPQALYV